jgi:LysM repeat protein
VQPGDTFDSIADQHNISVDELIAVNGFSEEVSLGAGEVLQIPAHPKGSVIIDGVIGVGDLQSERVLLKHRGEGELSLNGWRLQDEDGNEYIFPPALVLYKGGAVNVYTKAGVNTVVDLFWGLSQPVWKSGEKATLRDAQGNARAQFTVP